MNTDQKQSLVTNSIYHLKDNQMALRELRDSYGKKPESTLLSPVIYAYLFQESDVTVRPRSVLTPMERASYLALTVYACLQYGQDECKHLPKKEGGKTVAQAIGIGVAKIAGRDEKELEKARSRFTRLIKSSDVYLFARYLKDFIPQIKESEETVDFEQLAWDLYNIQNINHRHKTIIHWIREFENSLNNELKAKGEKGKNE